MIKRFELVRTKDATGIFGTGKVAEGACFADNSVAMQWVVRGKPSSLVIYKSIEDILQIHNHVNTKHEGGTEIKWID